MNELIQGRACKMKGMDSLERNALRVALTGAEYLTKRHQLCMKHIKSQVRTRITDVHLENCLRVATASVEINFDALSSAKQSQTCHFF